MRPSTSLLAAGLPLEELMDVLLLPPEVLKRERDLLCVVAIVGDERL